MTKEEFAAMLKANNAVAEARGRVKCDKQWGWMLILGGIAYLTYATCSAKKVDALGESCGKLTWEDFNRR